MKRYLSLILALMLLLSVNVGALSLDKYNFSMSLGEDYSALTEDNISRETELVGSLGYSTASMQQYFKDNSLILFAVSADGSRQLQVTCRQTEFSTRMGDLALLEDEEVLNLVNRFVTVKTASDLTLVNFGGMKLYEVVSVDKDSGGSFCSIQYITVRGGKLYTISFFENAAAVSEQFKDFAFDTVSTLSIGGNKKVTFSGAENITEMIIVALLLVLAAAVTVTLIVSFVRDFIRYDETKRTSFIRRRRK